MVMMPVAMFMLVPVPVLVVSVVVVVMTWRFYGRPSICSQRIPGGVAVIVLMAVLMLAVRIVVVTTVRQIYRLLAVMRESSHSWRGTGV